MTKRIDWETLYQRHRTAMDARDFEAAREVDRHARTLLQNHKLQCVAWLEEALTSEGEDAEPRRRFIAHVLRLGEQMPKLLFEPMLYAAVHEGDPSLNADFARPVIRCFGAYRTNERLIEYLRSGSDDERAGAAQVMYWTWSAKDHRADDEEELADLYEEARTALRQAAEDVEDPETRRRIRASWHYRDD